MSEDKAFAEALDALRLAQSSCSVQSRESALLGVLRAGPSPSADDANSMLEALLDSCNFQGASSTEYVLTPIFKKINKEKDVKMLLHLIQCYLSHRSTLFSLTLLTMLVCCQAAIRPRRLGMPSARFAGLWVFACCGCLACCLCGR